LDQRRVEGVSFDVVPYTNFTRDHLDYHGTMEQYFAAKAKLIDHLLPHGTVVYNVDDKAWGASRRTAAASGSASACRQRKCTPRTSSSTRAAVRGRWRSITNARACGYRSSAISM